VAMQLGGIRETDVLYTPLPLCHSSAMLLGLGPAVTAGTTVVLKRKFSASMFWKDCAHYNATVLI
jgi:solute carrier family 27 fatty acid transporter 2